MRRLELWILGDGARDELALPCLVENLLGRRVEVVAVERKAWKEVRLHHGHGYGKKLLFALRTAERQGADGLVATVDQDASGGERLDELHIARRSERDLGSSLPAVVGEAIPAGEAWLLDDVKAVRDALGLPASRPIPSTRSREHPKAILRELVRESPVGFESERVALEAIARLVEIRRSPRSGQTGFAAFADEVDRELGPSC